MFKYKKSLGQNFLQNHSILKKIVSRSLIEGKNVLEIGPGDGALTRYLFPLAKSLTVIEKDDRLIGILKKEFENNVKIVNKDFLEWDMNIERSTIVANIPYNITSPIIEKILKNRCRVDRAFLTIQKEVAERIVAKPGDKNRGVLSVLVQMFCDVKIEFVIPKNNFFPVPKIDSALMSMDINRDPELAEETLKMAKILFSQKRKQITNPLTLFFDSKDSAKEALTSLNIDYTLRAEKLTIEEISKIAKFCKDNNISLKGGISKNGKRR